MFKKSAQAVAAATLVLFSSAVGAGTAQAAGTTPFSQCPHIGASASCGILIVLNADGTASVLQDPGVGPFDGIEDTLVAVQNNTTAKISHLMLSSDDEPIFGFDGDGICAYQVNSGCGATGYEGPNTAFTVRDANHGDVAFPAGLKGGQSTYFSLEERLDAADFILPVGSAASAPLLLNGTAPAGQSAATGAGTTSQAGGPVPDVVLVPAQVSATVLRSSSAIDAGSASASASVHSVNIAGTVKLLGLHSNAASSCTSPPSGSSGLQSGSIGGQQLPPSSPPNTVYSAGTLRVVLNEQLATLNGVTVNAAHITGAGLDLVLGSSRASTSRC